MTTTLTTAYITTTSAILKKDLHTPFSGANALSKIRGLLGMLRDSMEATFTTATTAHVARHEGVLRRILIGVAAQAAASETIQVDVQVNGVSVFTSVPIVATTSSAASAVFDVSSLITAGVGIKVGDAITIIRTIANGATINDVTIEWG